MHVLSVQALYGSGLLRTAVPVLESLRSLKLDVAMGVLWRRQVCYLYFASANTPTSEAIGGRGLFAAEHSGIGLPLLAAMPDAEVRSLYEDEPSTLKALLPLIRAARSHGYAYLTKSEHRTSDVVGVAVGESPFAAISLFGKIAPTRVPALVERLRDAADRIANTNIYRSDHALAAADR
jgi:DNA-binding IclR family transcriptional regulator